MANTLPIVHKRTSISGRLPEVSNTQNSSYIRPGELSINLTDKKVHSSNGSALFEVGSNLTNLSVQTITANGNIGAANQVLRSDGSKAYWDYFVGYAGSAGFTGSAGSGFTGSVGFTGSQGNVGPQGAQGFAGPQGPTGFTGSHGDLGFTGSQGVGFTGSQGDTGFTGSVGSLGFTGSQGAIGPQGVIGPQGAQGIQGEIGFTGSAGVGYTGSKGDTGFVGSKGEIGFTGSQGIGFTGSAGPQGEIGFTGSQGGLGPAGPQGSTGFVGSKGDLGFTGSQGIGFTGSQGEIGFTGSQGEIGFTGSAGAGYTGSQGEGTIAGGTTGDIIYKVSSTDYDVEWRSLAEESRIAVAAVTRDMNGFPNRTETSLHFDESTRTFTIAPTANNTWHVYARGEYQTITGNLQYTIANTPGGRYIRYNPTTQTLEDGGVFIDFREDISVAYTFWDAANNKIVVFGDERHGSNRDVEWHYAQHRNLGTIWRSGGALTYTLDDDTNVNIGVTTPLVIADEDMEHTITHSALPDANFEQILSGSASLEIVYLAGAHYTITEPTTTPWLNDTGTTAYYNPVVAGSGSLAEAGEGKYFTYWLVATHDINNPVKLILGRNIYDSISEAYGEEFNGYGISFSEYVFMYQIVVTSSGSYAAPAKIRIAAVRRLSERLPTATASYSAQSHDALTDRDLADQHSISAITGLTANLDSKQATLISGTNIKTINGTTILGPGDITAFGYTGSQGNVGFTGSSGDIGFTGSQGPTGPQGNLGYTGSQGPAGALGPQGTQGPTGPQGLQGDPGYAGSKGDPGFTGSQGPTGAPGPQGNLGYTGSQGPTGAPGPQGTQGEIGPQGAQGLAGPQGLQGDPGYAGSKGDLGFTGSQGPQGAIGPQGDPGFTGSQGDTGPIGPAGPQGAIGPQGAQGAQGDLGYTGSQGGLGFAGSQGAQGTQGPQGEIGFTGSQGEIGFTGSQGAVGFTGSLGYTGSKGTDGFSSVGRIYYFQGSLSDITPYDELTLNVSSLSEDVATAVANNTSGEVLIEGHMTPAGQPDLTSIPAGQITWKIWFGVSDAAGDSRFVIRTYKVATGTNAETELFNLESPIVNNTEPQLYEFSQFNQESIPLLATDRIVVKVFFKTTSTSNITGTFVHDGPTRQSYVITPISQGVTGYTGSKGFTGSASTVAGPPGPQGDLGYHGSTGFTGSQGAQGVIGPQGTQGATGPAGPPGPQGDLGYHGSTGFTGSQGAQGGAGPAGPAGPPGPQGDLGYHGSTGFTGSQGAQGGVGPAGPPGPQGDLGYHGSTGFTGSQGAQGGAGPAGPAGPPGPQGDLGYHGSTGFTGSQGAQGGAGPAGPPGPQGDLGYHGSTGFTGSQGAQGGAGPAGPAGPPGPQGDLGYHGSTGFTGSIGFTGSVGITRGVFTFGGTGIPTTGNAVTPYVRVMAAATCVNASLVAKTAPSGGSFVVAILRSADNGATFPTTVATITATTGNRVATTTTTTALAQGDLLRLDITSVNGASDWTAQLYVNS